MKRFKMTALFMVIIALLLGIFFRENLFSLGTLGRESFFATVIEVRNDALLIRSEAGEEIFVRLVDVEVIASNQEVINASDFLVGDEVQVTFSGEVMLSHPAQLREVFRVERLR